MTVEHGELRGRALAKLAPIMALRTLGLALLIFAAVSVQPREPTDPTSLTLVVIAVLLIWGSLFGLVFWWQMRRISRAEHPQAAMVEALAIVFVLFLAIFAKTYHILSQAFPTSFSEDLDFFSSLYFSLTVLSTVGFGDITPESPLARGVTMLQMALDLVLIGVAVRVISGAAARALKNRRRTHHSSHSRKDAAAHDPSSTAMEDTS